MNLRLYGFVRSLFCLSLLGFSCLAGGTEESRHLLVEDEWVKVSAERALYEEPGNPSFLIHVIITNLKKEKIGVDLNDVWKVIRINQWGMSETDHRMEINEERASEPAKLDNKIRENLGGDFKEGKLQIVEPGAELSYYINFMGPCLGSAAKKEGKYCLIVMDGDLFLTNGSQFDLISLREKEQEREVAIPSPLVLKKIPAGAFVLGRSSIN